MHTLGMTKKRDSPVRLYDASKAIARWETDGGAPERGRPWNLLAVSSGPVGVNGEQAPPSEGSRAKEEADGPHRPVALVIR